MPLRIDSASFRTSRHLEVFRFCTRPTSVCCNHSCKNLCFVIIQKLCRIKHVTIATNCSKVVSNPFAIHWKWLFKRPNVFSTTTRLILSTRPILDSSGMILLSSEQVSWANFRKNMLNHQVLRDSILRSNLF